MSRMSQAFAAERTSLCAALTHELVTAYVPAFNAEAEDVRREHAKMSKNVKFGEALADHKKRARIQDMAVRREMFIKTLQTKLSEGLLKRVKDYQGEIKDEMDEKTQKPVKVAYFPDGTKAKFPKALWVDFSMFQRV